jgi:outer membrane protein TolC
MKKYSITLLLAMISLTVSGQIADSAGGLPFYLATAARNNPAVKAAFLAYEASLQKIPQMGAYEDPQLEMGFFLRPMDIIDGRQIGQFQLMQMFPWFGTRKAARTEAQHMAKMTFEQFRETRDNLFLEVYIQWYSLCSLQQKLMNSRENVELLKQLEILALQKFKSPVNSSETGGSQRMGSSAASTATGNSSGGMSGMSMGNKAVAGETTSSPGASTIGSMSMNSPASGMSEVLRIQLEMTELESNIESLLSEIHAGKVRFNALLNRPVETGIVVPDSISQILFSLDEEEIMSLITQQNPMLGMINEESLAYDAKAEMDRKMSYPMFGIGLQYMLIGKTSQAAAPENPMEMEQNPATESNMSSMNGKDMIMPMLSVSIPIFRGKYRAAQRETKLLRQANEEKYADALNMLQADLYRFKHQLDDAVRKITLYRKQTGLAQMTYHLVLKEFISGKSDLSDVIQVQRQLLDYQLKVAEAIADYNVKTASIQKLISTNNEQFIMNNE